MVAFAFLLFVNYVSKFKIQTLLSVWWMTMPFVVFIFLINALLVPGETIGWQFLSFSEEGMLKGTIYSLRLLFLIGITTLLTMTTNSMLVIDALKRLCPRKTHFCAELSMIIVIALRFVPVLMREASELFLAQIARGIIQTDNLSSRVRSLVPLMLPIINRALVRAEYLGMALDLRGYDVTRPRTSYTQVIWTSEDTISSISVMTLIIILLWMNLNV